MGTVGEISVIVQLTGLGGGTLRVGTLRRVKRPDMVRARVCLLPATIAPPKENRMLHRIVAITLLVSCIPMQA